MKDILRYALCGTRATFTVIRRSDGEYIDGRWHEGTPQRLEGTGSLQPLTARDVENLPSGLRSDDAKVIFTEYNLYMEETGERKPDVVEYNGQEYQISGKADWSAIAGYYRYVLARTAQS